MFGNKFSLCSGYRKTLKINPAEQKQKFRNQIIATIGCGFVHSSIGILFGFTAISLPEMMNPSLGDPLMLTEEEATYLVGGLSIGGLIGSFISGPVLLQYGHKRILLFSIASSVVWWIIMSQAKVFWLLLMCRLLQGASNGLIAGVCQTYVAEVCHPRIRGRMIGLIDIFRQIGFIFVFSVGSSGLTWRNVALICGISAQFMPFIIISCMSDSPRWLASKNRYDQAEKSLKFFRGDDYDISEELNSIMEQISNPTKKLTLTAQAKLLKNKSLAVIFVVLVVCSFLLHFTGSVAIQSYAVIIFSAATDKVDAYLSTIISGVARFFGSLIFFMLSDKFNRRTMFLVPNALSLIFVACLGTYFFFQDTLVNISYANWIPIACVLCYNICFGAVNPAITCMRAELLPNEFRSFGTGIIYMGFYTGIFIVAVTFFTLKNTVGLAGTFWTYSLIGVVLFLMVLIFLPETAGKTLENINVIKAKKIVA